jgi:hypothetical protein
MRFAQTTNAQPAPAPTRTPPKKRPPPLGTSNKPADLTTMSKPPTSTAITAEVVTSADATAADLRAIADRINDKISIITGHEAAFEDATLEHRLLIGLELSHAKAAFGLTKAQAGAIGGSKSTVDMLPDPASQSLGFTVWLAREVPDFKRGKADYYINAFQSLGLSRHEATPKVIREKIKALNHQADKAGERRPTLKSLYKIGKPAKPEGTLLIEPPKDSAQLRLEDARESFHLWREKFESLLAGGVLDDLDRPGLLTMKEFLAGARDRVNARLK